MSWLSAAAERDLCGDANSIGTALLFDQLLVPTISVPVLLAYGDRDLFFGPAAAVAQKARFAGSNDVSLGIVPDSGHLVMLQRTAPVFKAMMDAWLSQRGF
jgi:pimeloyl-ACP methyl ester carboxylesterase